MKKLLTGVKKDLRIELKGVKLLILCFSFTVPLFSQVPIKGFCNLETFPVYKDYNRLMVSDINSDLQIDLLLYSPSSNKICVIEKDDESKYRNVELIWSPDKFSRILPVKNNKTGTLNYVLASRRQRSVNYFDLPHNKRLKLIAGLTFDSYPGNIISADINNDGKGEVLVSGSAFKGLSIISLESDKITEKKIEENSSYGEAVFADISNDNYQDIAAFNLINYDLEIFFNDASGNFSKTRSFSINSGINNLNSVDLNGDYYTDIIYCSNHSINILWGDFQSSYDSISVLTTEFFPHSYSIADFNGDRFDDIAYIDSSKGLLSIFFGKGNNSFYPELLYYKSNGLVDIQNLKSGEGNNLVLLNRNGEINIISKTTSFAKEMNLVPALQPAAVSTFDFGNNGTLDYCVIDEYTQTLNFIINTESNIPALYFSVPVSANHANINVDDKNPFNKGFYCYTTGQNMLEIINYDFNNYNNEIHQLYIPSVIKDVKIKNIENITQIFVAFEDENVLRVNEYEYHDFRYTVREYSGIDLNTISPLLSVQNDPIIYYWKAGKDSLMQYSLKIRSEFLEKNQIGSVSRSNAPGITNIAQSILSYENSLVNSLFFSDVNLLSVVTGDKSFNISNSIFYENNLNINDKLKLRFESNDKETYNSIFYSESNNRFNRVEIDINANELTLQELFEVENVAGYTRQKLSESTELLIYTQTLEGKLSLKLLEY